MKNLLCSYAVITLFLSAGSIRVLGQQHPPMPPGMTHEEHFAQMQRDADMNKRGAAAMGFDQEKVAHHFRLAADGGTIQVDVKDASDDVSRQAIRTHLQAIATAFADGQFDAPLITHAEMPPGASDLQRLKSTVTYAFGETKGGGMVRISTTNTDALDAIHRFLRYQITEHHTGDPLTIGK